MIKRYKKEKYKVPKSLIFMQNSMYALYLYFLIIIIFSFYIKNIPKIQNSQEILAFSLLAPPQLLLIINLIHFNKLIFKDALSKKHVILINFPSRKVSNLFNLPRPKHDEVLILTNKDALNYGKKLTIPILFIDVLVTAYIIMVVIQLVEML